MKMRPYKDVDGTWRIDRIPIVETGIEYDLSTGPVTFTEEDLIDAVLAYEDPLTVAPRVKLGHTSGFNAMIGDGEPAFGRVENLTLAENGQSIVADYTGMPEWLAKIAPIAYPSRSVDAVRNVTLANARNYKMMIFAVSNLGVYWPGCTGIEDLPLWFSDEIPDDAVINVNSEALEAVAAGGGMKLKRREKKKIAAAVDVDLVRRKFNREIAVGDDYWMWVRGIKLDEGFLIVEDEQEGALYRYPVTANDNGDIEFGEPVEVTEAYPDKVAASSLLFTGMTIADPSMVVYASRAESRAEDQSTQEGASAMDDATRKGMASALGLPEDASEEQINAEVARLKEGSATPASDDSRTLESGQQGSASTAPAADDAGTTGPAPDPKRESAPVATGPITPAPDEEPLEAKGEFVQIDRKTLETLQAGASAGLEVQSRERAKLKDDIIMAAMQDGKFAPASAQHFRKLLDADFEGAKKTIDALEAGLVPVHLRGTGGNTEQEELAAGNGNDGLPQSWFPEIERARQNTGSLVTMAKEG